MKKILIYLGLADVSAPKPPMTLRTVHIDRDLSSRGYNEWMAYICEQLGYPEDVIDKYKKYI